MLRQLIDKLTGAPDCAHVMGVLQQYLDGETTEQEARAVVKHLHRCARCEGEAKTYEKIKLVLSQARPELDPVVREHLQQFAQDLPNIEPHSTA